MWLPWQQRVKVQPLLPSICCKWGKYLSHIIPVYAAGLNNFGQCGYNTAQSNAWSQWKNKPRTRETNSLFLPSTLIHVVSSSSGCVWTWPHPLISRQWPGFLVWVGSWWTDRYVNRELDSRKKLKINFDAVLVLFTSLLGIGGYSDVSSPTRIQLPSDLSFSSVYTCADTSFARTSESLAEPTAKHLLNLCHTCTLVLHLIPCTSLVPNPPAPPAFCVEHWKAGRAWGQGYPCTLKPRGLPLN